MGEIQHALFTISRTVSTSLKNDKLNICIDNISCIYIMSTEIKHYDISESSESSESSFIVTEHHSIASSEKSRVRVS
jgi:hypothetical protein